MVTTIGQWSNQEFQVLPHMALIYFSVFFSTAPLLATQCFAFVTIYVVV